MFFFDNWCWSTQGNKRVIIVFAAAHIISNTFPWALSCKYVRFASIPLSILFTLKFKRILTHKKGPHAFAWVFIIKLHHRSFSNRVHGRYCGTLNLGIVFVKIPIGTAICDAGSLGKFVEALVRLSDMSCPWMIEVLSIGLGGVLKTRHIPRVGRAERA